MRKILITLAMLSISFSANADETYGQVSLAEISTDAKTDASESGDIDSGYSLQGVLGKKLNDYFSVELEVGRTVKALSASRSESGLVGGETVTASDELEWDILNVGAYFKASSPRYYNFSAYAKAGWGYMRIDYTRSLKISPAQLDTSELSGSSSGDDNDNGLTYGVGINYAINEKLDLLVEYIKLPELEDIEFSLMKVGVNINI